MGLCDIDRRYSDTRDFGNWLSILFFAMDIGDYFHRPKKSSRTTVSEGYRRVSICDVVTNDSLFRPAQARSPWRCFFSKMGLILAYSFFGLSEWTLVFLAAGFDAVSILDFGEFELQVVKRRTVGNEESGILVLDGNVDSGLENLMDFES
jgi:hypothetical protein